MNLIAARLGLLLFVSGMCSLVFQTSWFREFRLIFGASTPASSAVLAVFMGGLGLGNAVLGKWADQLRNPLRYYAILEFWISIFCLLSPLMLLAVRWLYLMIGGQETLGMIGGTLFRLLGTALVIGPPTFLMGGTLPFAAKAATDDDDVGRRAVGLLYGINTLGAVIGAVLGTFFLFEFVGTRGTLYFAAGVNAVNALVALWLSRASDVDTERRPSGVINERAEKPSEQEARLANADTEPRGSIGWISFLAGIVGAMFFLMEIVWYRMLGPILGGSTFTFGLILAVALAGIGFGGAIYSRLFKSRRPSWRAFGYTLAGESLALAIPFALGDSLAILAMTLRQFSIFGFWGQAICWAVITLIVVFPASLLAGIQFALLVGLIGEGKKDIGAGVGRVYAFNTLGSILGAIAGGFGLLTLLSAPGVWALVVVVLAALSVVIIFKEVNKDRRESISLLGTGAIVCMALLCISTAGPTALWRHSGIGAGRLIELGRTQNDHIALKNELLRQIVFEADGRESAIAISSADSLAFLVNGKSDGNAYVDAGTQIMLGVIGAMQHSNAEDALVVGLGTGESAGWLASLPTLERVDVVELEPAVLEMARLCHSINHDVLNHPKVNIIINDAREHLQTTHRRYDLIASEPSNPYRTGVSSLYTQEFYMAAASRLKPGGIFSQWLQAYEVDVETIRTVFATLRSVFPYMEVWQTLPGDMVITCSLEPMTYGIDSLTKVLDDPAYASATRVAWSTTQVNGVLSHLIAGDEFAAKVAEQSPFINDDNRNRLEFGFARSVGRNSGFDLQGLLGESMALGLRWPERFRATIDETRVADLAIATSTLSASGVLAGSQNSPRVAIWKAVEMDEHANAIAIWDSLEAETQLSSLDFAELALLGIAMAKAKDSRVVNVLSQMERFSTANAHGLAAMAIHPQSHDVLAEQLTTVLRSASVDPTILPIFLLNALVQSPELIRQQPRHAAKLYAVLRSPLALHRHEGQRIAALIEAAKAMGVREVSSVMNDFEPHPLWSEPQLELRLEAYEKTGSDLIKRAKRDRAIFKHGAAETRLVPP
jgi:spermidine synthase